MPEARFLGPHYETRSLGKDVRFPRGAWVYLTQAWLDDNRNNMYSGNFEIRGDEFTVDQGGDGLPDDGWTRADIMAWLKEQGVPIGRTYKTKTALLGMVEQQLNPPAPEPVVEEAEVEVVEEAPVTEAETETETMEE